jgi:integral membrane protein
VTQESAPGQDATDRGGINFGDGLLDRRQPAVTPQRLASAAGPLKAYRFMAFLTGVVLLAGTIALILKYAASVDFGGVYAALWIAHGWLFVVYVIVTAVLGLRLRWPPARYVLVMLAGTIPTMSFVAEHFVTRAAKAAAA